MLCLDHMNGYILSRIVIFEHTIAHEFNEKAITGRYQQFLKPIYNAIIIIIIIIIIVLIVIIIIIIIIIICVSSI